MLRWLELLSSAFDWLGRLYGVFFVGFGVLLLYWGGRGLLAYEAGIRAAWTEPLACAAGIVAGALSLWAGSRVVRKGIPPSTSGAQSELDATLEEAMRLERTDPGAAQQLLDSYFMREAAVTESKRGELRQRARYDIDAAVELRRELQEELTGNAAFKKDMLERMPEGQRASMLIEIDAADRKLRSQLMELDSRIDQLKLR